MHELWPCDRSSWDRMVSHGVSHIGNENCAVWHIGKENNRLMYSIISASYNSMQSISLSQPSTNNIYNSGSHHHLSDGTKWTKSNKNRHINIDKHHITIYIYIIHLQSFIREKTTNFDGPTSRAVLVSAMIWKGASSRRAKLPVALFQKDTTMARPKELILP